MHHARRVAVRDAARWQRLRYDRAGKDQNIVPHGYALANRAPRADRDSVSEGDTTMLADLAGIPAIGLNRVEVRVDDGRIFNQTVVADIDSMRG